MHSGIGGEASKQMEKMQLIKQGKLEDCDNLEDTGGTNVTKKRVAS